MPRLLCIFTAMFVIIVFAHAQQETRDKQDRQIKIIREKLQKIEDFYISKLNFRERREAIQIMDEVIDTIEKPSFQYLPLGSNAPDMSAEYFTRLIANAKKEQFGENKMLVLLSGSLGRLVTVDQLVEMCGLFAWGEQKLGLIKMFYPVVKDKEKNYKLVNVLTFESERKELQDFIEGK